MTAALVRRQVSKFGARSFQESNIRDERAVGRAERRTDGHAHTRDIGGRQHIVHQEHWPSGGPCRQIGRVLAEARIVELREFPGERREIEIAGDDLRGRPACSYAGAAAPGQRPARSAQAGRRSRTPVRLKAELFHWNRAQISSGLCVPVITCPTASQGRFASRACPAQPSADTNAFGKVGRSFGISRSAALQLTSCSSTMSAAETGRNRRSRRAGRCRAAGRT